MQTRRNGFFALGMLFLLIAAPWFEAQADTLGPARHGVWRQPSNDATPQKTTGHTVSWFLEFTEDVVIDDDNDSSTPVDWGEVFFLKKHRDFPTTGDPWSESGTVSGRKDGSDSKYVITFTNFGDLENTDNPSTGAKLAFGTRAGNARWTLNYILDLAGNRYRPQWVFGGSQTRERAMRNGHYLVDNVHPKLTITGFPAATNARDPQVTFTFHEDVTGFAFDDISGSSNNGTFSEFRKTSDRVWTAKLAFAREGAVTVSVGANAAKDGFDNNSLAGSLSATVDWTAPRVTSVVRQEPTDYRTGANTLKWRVTFNEEVTGVAAGDFAVSGTSAGLSVAAVPNSSGRQYDVTASGGDVACFAGEVRLSFKQGYTITDVAGNALTNSTPTGSIKDTYMLENTDPSLVSILRTTRQHATPVKYETNAESVFWRLTFSERVKGIEWQDFFLSGTDSVTGKALFSGTGAWGIDDTGGTQYLVHGTGGDVSTFNGVVTLNIRTSHGIKDVENCVLTSRTPTGVNEHSFLLDRIRPTLTISGVPPVANGAFTATLRFNEVVEGFEVGDIDATNATLSSFTATTEGQEWTVDVTPSADFQLAVKRDRARDAAGNGNAANDGSGASGTFGGVTVSPESLAMDEGSSKTFTVVLDGEPTGDVEVALTSDNEDVTLDEKTLTFTTANWNSAQTVTVSAAEDDADVEADFATVTANPSGGGYDAVVDESVNVTVTDNDAAGAGMTVSPRSLALSEGSSGSFRVVLNAVPKGNVAVALTSNNGAVAPNPETLTFTTANWNVAQTVTVQALEDADAAPERATVTVAPSGGGYDAVANATVAVTVTDNDAPGAGMTVSPQSLALSEGASGSFRVELNAVPIGDVAVALTSNYGAVAPTPGTLTFTTANWNVAQTVTVQALEDADADNDSATVTVDPSGGGYDAVADETVAVTVTDNDTAGAGVTVVPASLAMEEGETGTFTVVLDVEPMGTVVVMLASNHEQVTLEPESLTFTTSNWDVAQTVTVSALEDVNTVTDNAMLMVDPSGGGYDVVGEQTVPTTVADNDEPLALAVIAHQTYRQHREIEAWTLPAATGGGGGELTYGLTPALPAGLVFEAATRQLSGIPTVAQGATIYSYSVTGADGSVVSRVFQMTVLEGPKPPTEEERQVVTATLVDVAQSALAGVSEAMRGRFGGPGCVTAVTLAGEEVKPEAAETAAGTQAHEQQQGEHGLEPKEALGTSAFQWSPECEGAQDRAGQWTLWGRGDVREFGGDVDQGSYEGTHWGGWIGVDRQLGEGLIAGAALSQGFGRVKLDVGEGSAKLRTELTAAWPYVRAETEEGGVLQVVLGAGRGTVSYDHVEREEEKADLEVMVGSLSGTRQIWSRDGMTLWATGEGGMVQAKTSGTEGEALAGLRGEGWRLRGGMEGSYQALRLGDSGAALTPHGSLMVTHDGGDGVSGTGLELSAGARVETGNPRFGLSATAHWLALYSGARDHDWGGSVEALWRADARGRGLSFKLAPTWGIQSGSTSAEVSEASDVFASLEDRFDSGAALTSRLGYGVAMEGRGTLTPFLEASLGGGGDGWRRMSAGAELEWQPGVAAAVVGERAHDTDGAGDSRLRIDLRVRF